MSDDPVIAELEMARTELLAIWPRGENCEHTHAAACFRHLNNAIAARRAELEFAAKLVLGLATTADADAIRH